MIGHNPWGPAARAVETVAGGDEHYWADALMQQVLDRAGQDVERRGRIAYAEQIRAWRAATGMTLRETIRSLTSTRSRCWCAP